MKSKLFVILAVIFCECVTGCTTGRNMNDISQISYTSNAGTISPELQWYEEIIITNNNVTLTRQGRTTDTEINEGSWEFVVDEQNVAALFAQLESVDVTSIKRIEPEDPVDGGDAVSYTIVYANSKTFSLAYVPGTTYTDGMLIVNPIEIFIQSLNLPIEAISRYK